MLCTFYHLSETSYLYRGPNVFGWYSPNVRDPNVRGQLNVRFPAARQWGCHFHFCQVNGSDLFLLTKHGRKFEQVWVYVANQ